jgi:hypothetical protein
MSHSCGGSLLLPEILERLSRGRSAASSATALPAGYTEGPAPAPPVWRRAYHRLPGGLRDKAYRIRSKAASMLLGRESLLCADPTVKAFAVGLGLGAGYSGVRLNLAGREPHGALSPGVEQERFCDRLIADLLELRHHDADRPMVCKVHRARDLYAGERIDELPDLLVEWESEPPMGTSAAGQGAGAVWRAVSPNTGIVEMPNGYCRTGEHRREGLLVARGAGIAPRAIDRTLSILDLAPTFAYMLGCEMPVGQRTVIPELSGRPG